MSIFTIPLRTDLVHYDFSVDLDGVTYGFEIRWNERIAGWYFDLYDIDWNPLVSGRRIAVDVPLLIRQRAAGIPPGQLIATDTTGAGEEAGLGDLGGRVQLRYFDAAEFA